VEGRDVHLEYRWPKGGLDGFPTLPAQLAQRRFDVIVAISSGAARATKRATETVPIVFCAVGEDPVTLAVELEAKRLELLKEAVPGLSHRIAMPDVEVAARRLNFRVIPAEWKAPADLEKGFQLAGRERVGGVLALTRSRLCRSRESPRIRTRSC
jgi:hypothetical protein